MNSKASKYFAETAKFLRRDLRNGDYQQSELPEVISAIWRDDEDELRRSYEIESLSELKAGIMSALPTKRMQNVRMTKAGYFAYKGKLVRRDLKNGSYTEADLPEHIAGIWRDDEDELRGSYGIESLAELKAGIMAAIPTKRSAKAKKKAPKKTAKKVKRKKSRAWWQLW